MDSHIGEWKRNMPWHCIVAVAMKQNALNLIISLHIPLLLRTFAVCCILAELSVCMYWCCSLLLLLLLVYMLSISQFYNTKRGAMYIYIFSFPSNNILGAIFVVFLLLLFFHLFCAITWCTVGSYISFYLSCACAAGAAAPAQACVIMLLILLLLLAFYFYCSFTGFRRRRSNIAQHTIYHTQAKYIDNFV